jgi:hypothetical protein
MNYRVTIRLSTNARGDELGDRLEPQYVHLLADETIEDPDLVAAAMTGRVEVTMVVSADDQLEAGLQGLVAVRAAP